VLALSDRIAVLYEGQIMGVVERQDTNVEELGMMMAGVRQEQLAEAVATAH
jgi:simple sugar transport system ATP-binding protein